MLCLAMTGRVEGVCVVPGNDFGWAEGVCVVPGNDFGWVEGVCVVPGNNFGWVEGVCVVPGNGSSQVVLCFTKQWLLPGRGHLRLQVSCWQIVFV